MIEYKPCNAWIVEFSYGMQKGHRKKLYLTAVDLPPTAVVELVKNQHPGTQFTVHNVDAAILTFPETMHPNDFTYQPDGRCLNELGHIMLVGEVTPQEEGQTITFKPPTFTPTGGDRT